MCIVAAAAAAAGSGVMTDAGDVGDVSVVDDSHTRLACKVGEITEEFLASRKQLTRVGAEALWRLGVVDVGHQRVPVVTQVELDVRFAGVAFVDADQLIVAWILLKEATYPRTHVQVSKISSLNNNCMLKS